VTEAHEKLGGEALAPSGAFAKPNRVRAAECLEFALTMTTNAMFGIETPMGRTPFQGASLDVPHSGLKRPTSQSDSTELAEVLRRGWLFGVTYHKHEGRHSFSDGRPGLFC